MENQKPKYKSSIVQELFDLITLYPEHTMGSIFLEFLRPCYLNGKTLLDANDEEIYSALELAKKRAEDVQDDQPMSAAEFEEWTDKLNFGKKH